MRLKYVHDHGRYEDGEECSRTQLRSRLINVAWTDMPNQETQGKKTEGQ